jgi:energy-coupling factor transport system ATP-binding protein
MRRGGAPRVATLRIDQLTVRVPGRAAPVLDGASLELTPGSVGAVLGASGAGKSTLLHTINGLLPWLRPGHVRGKLELDGEALADLDPGQRAHLLASCLDRADAQLFLPTPGHEVDAARRLYGDGPLLEAALDELGLRPVLDRPTWELSSGERQRLALAVAFAGSPRPVLLDEPTAHLDAAAVAALERLLAECRRGGGSVLLAEQAGWRLTGSVSGWWRVSDGEVSRCRPPVAPGLPRPHNEPGAEPVLALEDVAVTRGGRRLVEETSLEIRAGEIVLLSGRNGAGKSSFAEVVAGLRRPAGGRVRVGGAVALMLPSSELQLFAASVAEEVAAGAGGEPPARVLRRHRLEHLAARAPWTLSRGERQRLVHAALDLGRPALMVVDEPAQGLDADELVELVKLIHRRAERGRAYLVISHRQELAVSVHRHLELAEGRLREASRA